MYLVRKHIDDKLWSVTTFFWYMTVFSAFFMEYLFELALPIGGHIFLYRLTLPITVLLYGVWCIKHNYNPFKAISSLEKCMLILIISMLVYGATSFFWAINKGAWFSQMLSTGVDFCFFYLAVQFYKDSRTKKGTVILSCITMLCCCLGGLLELIYGCFFETPYDGESIYHFMARDLQSPAFCFYNPNGLAVSALWMLLVGVLYLFDNWDVLEQKKRRRIFLFAVISACICFFVLKATQSRLSLIAFSFFVIGLIIWILIRYRRGFFALVLLILSVAFINVGENYDYFIKYENYCVEINQSADIRSERLSFFEFLKLESDDQPTFVDGEGNFTVYTDQSGSVRANLLKNSFEMILESKCFGIGVGNSELRMSEYDNTSNYTDVHCFVVELILEWGIFALIPLVSFGLILVCNWIKWMNYAINHNNQIVLSNTLFQIFTVITYPFLSTANSSSWGIAAMWLFLAYIVQNMIEREERFSRKAC